MSVIDLSQITNPPPHQNVLLQQGKLPDLSGIKLKAENCMNDKVTVNLAANRPEKPEHPGRPEPPGKPGHRPHQSGIDEFYHQKPPANPGIYDCPGKPKPPEVSLTFIKPLTLHPQSCQLPNGQSIPLDADGSAWLVQPDDTIQKVQLSELFKQLGLNRL